MEKEDALGSIGFDWKEDPEAVIQEVNDALLSQGLKFQRTDGEEGDWYTYDLIRI